MDPDFLQPKNNSQDDNQPLSLANKLPPVGGEVAPKSPSTDTPPGSSFNLDDSFETQAISVNDSFNDQLDHVGVVKKKFNPFKSETFSLFLMIFIGIAVGLLLSQFVFRPYRVVGESMSQTLHSGDRLIVNKLGKTASELFGNDYLPKRGEIIVFSSPFNSELLVKRVIGLPGDRVVVNSGQITIFNDDFPDGFNPDDDTYYQANLPDFTTGNVDILVTNGHIFVSGDNRTPNGSSDSRNELGLVPVENVVGNVTLKLLPLGEARFY